VDRAKRPQHCRPRRSALADRPTGSIDGFLDLLRPRRLPPAGTVKAGNAIQIK
jgi:hypothetical protein